MNKTLLSEMVKKVERPVRIDALFREFRREVAEGKILAVPTGKRFEMNWGVRVEQKRAFSDYAILDDDTFRERWRELVERSLNTRLGSQAKADPLEMDDDDFLRAASESRQHLQGVLAAHRAKRPFEKRWEEKEG